MSKLSDQYNELKEKTSKGILNLNQKQTKMVTWGAYLVIGLILLSMLSNNLFGGGKDVIQPNPIVTTKEPQITQRTETDISLAEQELEMRLEKILSQIQGAGKVSVNVSLAASPYYQYAVNVMANTRQTDEEANNGTRRISENQEEGKLVITRGSNNQEIPVVVRKSKPDVLGVLVVADGAADAKVRLELSRAVETVMGISSHQVHVVARER